MSNDHLTNSPTHPTHNLKFHPEKCPKRTRSRLKGGSLSQALQRWKCGAWVRFLPELRWKFPMSETSGGKTSLFFVPNLSQLVIWSQVKISEAEIQISSKSPQLLQGDTHVSIGVKDIFWDLYLKMTGVRQTFPTKIQVGKVFWSEGPKFRMKGLFPSCQVLGFGPTTKYLTWISARHCCQKSSHLCGPLARPQGFFHSTSRGEIIPVNLEPIYFRPCFTRPDSYNDQLGARATPHLPSCVQFRHAGPTSDKRRTGGVIGVGSPVIIAANEVEKKWTEIWRWSPQNHLDVLSGVRN